MVYRLSEEYRPRYEGIAPAYQTGPLAGTRYDKIRQQIEEEGAVRAQQLQDMVEKPIEAYQQASDREYRKAQAEEALEASRGQRALQDVQRRKSEVEAQLAEEYGAEDYRTRLDMQQAQTEAAQASAAAAKREQKILDTVDPETGKTFGELQVTEPLTISRKQLSLAERNQQMLEENARIDRHVKQLGIDEIERKNRVRQLQANISLAPDQASRKQIIDNLMKLGNVSEVAEALSNIKDAEQRAELMRRLDPAYQQRLSRAMGLIQHQQQALAFKADLDSYITELQNAPSGSPDAQAAAERAAAALSQMGYEAEAKEMYEAWQRTSAAEMIRGDFIKTRLETAKETRNKILNREAASIRGQYQDLPGAVDFANSLSRAGYSIGQQKSQGNLFLGGGTPQVSDLGAIMNGTNDAIQQYQLNVVTGPNGQPMFTPPQPPPQQSVGGAFAPQLNPRTFDILRQGRQRSTGVANK